MNCNILDKIYNDDKSKIKFLYKYFKNDINRWIHRRKLKGLCLHTFCRGKNKGNYCLAKTENNYTCKEHDLKYKYYKYEIKLLNNIDINYFPVNPNIINNMLDYKEKYVEPSAPSFIYFIDENSIKKIESLYINSSYSSYRSLKLITYNNYIYKNKKEKLNINNINKMDDKKEPSVLLKQNLKIANNSINKIDNNSENSFLEYFKGYSLYNMNNKFINMKIKNIISGDLIGARELYKNKINFRPQCIAVMTSNMLWQPNDSTNGLQRRFIYLTIKKMPKNKNIDLLNYENNIATGILLNDLPGLINWALDAEKEDLNLFKKSTLEINNLISPNLDKEVNPLLDWINMNLKYDENSSCLVGNKKTDKNTTLFANYLDFCNNNGFTPLSIIDFSNSLIQQLNLLWDGKEVTKKRTNVGFMLTNTALIKNTNLTVNDNSNDNNYDFNIYELLKDYIN